MTHMPRRQFCKAVGAGCLTAGLSTFARAYSPGTTKVIGIGGAGCNIVEQLREQEWLAGKVEALTVNRTNNYPRQNPIDLVLGPSDPRVVFSYTESDVENIHALMDGTQHLVLVAGLGGATGSSLITRFAASAVSAAVQVSSVVTTPFGFEGLRSEPAEEALRHLIRLTGRLSVIDNERALNELPPDVTMHDAFRYVDTLALLAIRQLLVRQQAGLNVAQALSR